MPKKVYKSSNSNGNGRLDSKSYFGKLYIGLFLKNFHLTLVLKITKDLWAGHDDRDVRMDDVSLHNIRNRPRVSFKNQTNRARNAPSIQRSGLVIVAKPEDMLACSESGSNKDLVRHVAYRGRGRGSLMGGRRSPVSQRGSRLPGRVNRGGNGPMGEASWYKIIVSIKIIIVATQLSAILISRFFFSTDTVW